MPPWRPFSSRRGTRPLWSSRGLHHGAAQRRARRGQAAHRRCSRGLHPGTRRRSTPSTSRSRSSVRTVGSGPRAMTRSSSRSSRCRSRSSSRWRSSSAAAMRCCQGRGGAQRRAVQRDQPRGGNRAPGEPDDQRGRDRDDGDHPGDSVEERTGRDRRPVLALRRPGARGRRVGVRLGVRDRRPQSRARLICCARTT